MQTPFYPDSMYGDNVNKGFPVGYYLDNLAVDFSGGLDPNQEDTIHVQIADYMSSALTQDHTMNTRFASGDFVVEFFALPDLDDGTRETVTATVTETRTGYVERIFILQETGEATNYFTAQPVNMSLDWNPDEPSTATLYYASNEVSLDYTIPLFYDAELEMYVDDEEDPGKFLLLLYSSGNVAEEPDSIVINYLENGESIEACLQESGNDTHKYGLPEPGERTLLNPDQPHHALFQVVAYLPEEEDLLNATVDAGAGAVTVPLTKNEFGLHVSSPLVGIKAGGSCSDIPNVISSGYYQCVEFSFNQSDGKDEEQAGDKVTVTAGNNTAEADSEKGGLLVFAQANLPKLTENKIWIMPNNYFPDYTIRYIHNIGISKSTGCFISLYLKKLTGLSTFRVLIMQDRDTVLDALRKTSHFFFMGHGNPGSSLCNDNLGWTFDGLILSKGLNTSDILRGADLDNYEYINEINLKLTILTSCMSAKTATRRDTEVENLFKGLKTKYYVGFQNAIPMKAVLEYLKISLNSFKAFYGRGITAGQIFLQSDYYYYQSGAYDRTIKDSEINYFTWGNLAVFQKNANDTYFYMSHCIVNNGRWYEQNMCWGPNETVGDMPHWRPHNNPTYNICPCWPDNDVCIKGCLDKCKDNRCCPSEGKDWRK